MAWGMGLILLAFSTNELPKCLNLKDMEGRRNYLLKLARSRYGWDFYDIVRVLTEPAARRLSCTALLQTKYYERFVSDEEQLATVRFRSLKAYQES